MFHIVMKALVFFAIFLHCVECGKSPAHLCLDALLKSLGPNKVIIKNIPPIYNKVYENTIPRGMIFPSNGADVVKSLNTCHEFGTTIAIRSNSGHSYVAQSTIDKSGVVINLRNLSKFKIVSDANHPTVRVGGGMALLELYSRLAMNDPPLGLNGGTCPSVSVGGLISGGGEGMTSTFAGMTSDRVVAARAVVYVKEHERFEQIDAEDDLLFALRGGMGGNYGIVTEWTLRVFPVDKVVVYSFKTRPLVPKGSDQEALSVLFRTYTAWLRNPSTPVPLGSGNSVWGMIKFLSGGVMQMNGQCKCATKCCTDCNAAIAYLKSILDKTIVVKTVSEIQDFGEAMWSWAGCTDFGGVPAYPSGGLSGISEKKLQSAMRACYKYDYENFRGPYKSKSLYMPDETVLDSSFESIGLGFVTLPICSIAKCYLQLSLVGGAMTIEHSNSAFVHRTPGFHLQMLVYWPNGMAEESFLDWTRAAREVMLPISLNEAYQNYPDIDLDLPTWSDEYFPREGVFERLIQIKCKYNPTDIFNVPQALSLMIPQTCHS